MIARALLLLTVILLLGSCAGSGSDGGSAPAPAPPVTPLPPPVLPPPGPAPATPGTGQCSLLERQRWAEAQIREWYLFPEDLPASIDPAQFTNLDDFIDALTARARAAGRDRFFTFATSIAEEDEFFQRGRTAAFGIRIEYDEAARRAFLTDVIETGPAAGLQRGTELLAIGTTRDTLRSVEDLMAQGGPAAVAVAFGPAQSGVTRWLRYRERGGTIDTRAFTRQVFDIPPVPLQGVRFFTIDGRRYGYFMLRTFIETAIIPLRGRFSEYRQLGIRDIIIDLRYNGGGLVRIAERMGDLMGRDRRASDVFSITRFRTSKAAENETRQFQSDPDSIAPENLAFITTGASASASELIINSMLPWHPGAVTLVGANTAGKPVGQIAIDRAECDDRLRILAFATDNARGEGDYFNGLAPVMAARGGRTCAARDDFTRSLADPGEASIAAAAAALRGELCTPIGGVAARTLDGRPPPQAMPLLPARPNAAQREMPGLF